jgi:heme oxygenase
MFKEFKEKKVLRFRDFDEARGFIENLSKESIDAIDYMIFHKEYYFLLKNLANQVDVDLEIISYIFSNLPCLKRKEDFELIKEIYENREDAREIIDTYLKTCEVN